MTLQGEEDRQHNGQMDAGSENCQGGAVTLLEPKVKVASQSVFYALRTRDGTCASGCGVSKTRVAEIVFGIEIVEWDLCSACLSRTGFLEYFNSLPSATPREAEEIRILLGSGEYCESELVVASLYHDYRVGVSGLKGDGLAIHGYVCTHQGVRGCCWA